MYARVGTLTFRISEEDIQIEIMDEGPGIPDIEQAMQPGFSTASDEMREMGFGFGMGLPNIKKHSDTLKIESQIGKGTTLFASIKLNSNAYELTHSFKIDGDKCAGRLGCMRACPTQAIRVKEGKAELLPELCIDCGSCLRVCPSGAITATTQSLKDVWKFKYKVAVPSAVLFGQFPSGITPAHIFEGLKSLGFDAVGF